MDYSLESGIEYHLVTPKDRGDFFILTGDGFTINISMHPEHDHVGIGIEIYSNQCDPRDPMTSSFTRVPIQPES